MSVDRWRLALRRGTRGVRAELGVYRVAYLQGWPVTRGAELGVCVMSIANRCCDTTCFARMVASVPAPIGPRGVACPASVKRRVGPAPQRAERRRRGLYDRKPSAVACMACRQSANPERSSAILVFCVLLKILTRAGGDERRDAHHTRRQRGTNENLIRTSVSNSSNQLGQGSSRDHPRPSSHCRGRCVLP